MKAVYCKPSFIRPLSATALIIGLAGCATMPSVRLTEGAVQEPLQALEDEVLEDARQFKERLDASGAVYEQATLQTYLEGLFQPLIPPEIRTESRYRFTLKVAQDPTLNAYTLGDGSIYVNTGLIARLKTSEQFSFVLGHEIAHVINRDMVYFTDSLHRKTITAKLAGLVITPALSAIGFGGLGELGISAAYLASVNGYGRERETAADEEGLKTMRRLNLDEREAMRVFDTFDQEHERYDRGIELGFLSSHPSNEERLKAVKTFMGPKALDVFTPEKIDTIFLDKTQDLRIDNAALNIKLGRCYHAVEDLQIILRRTPEDARARFQLAEAYRLIATDPKKLKDELSRQAWAEIEDIADREQESYWQSRALEEYQKALQYGPDFTDPHRGLGLLRLAQDDKIQALSHFQRYLELSPNAKDRRFVASQIERLRNALTGSQEE